MTETVESVDLFETDLFQNANNCTKIHINNENNNLSSKTEETSSSSIFTRNNNSDEERENESKFGTSLEDQAIVLCMKQEREDTVEEAYLQTVITNNNELNGEMKILVLDKESQKTILNIHDIEKEKNIEDESASSLEDQSIVLCKKEDQKDDAEASLQTVVTSNFEPSREMKKNLDRNEESQKSTLSMQNDTEKVSRLEEDIEHESYYILHEQDTLRSNLVSADNDHHQKALQKKIGSTFQKNSNEYISFMLRSEEIETERKTGDVDDGLKKPSQKCVELEENMRFKESDESLEDNFQNRTKLLLETSLKIETEEQVFTCQNGLNSGVIQNDVNSEKNLAQMEQIRNEREEMSSKAGETGQKIYFNEEIKYVDCKENKRPRETDQLLEENTPKRIKCDNSECSQETEVNGDQETQTKEQVSFCETDLNYTSTQAADNVENEPPVENDVVYEKSERNSELINKILTFSDNDISKSWETTSQQPYELILVPDNTTEYTKVQNIFSLTCRDIKMVKLERVQNSYILSHFLLKKAKMCRENFSVEEKHLFHGTRQEYIDAICKNNFNWRRCGSSRGHKFGQGVSFSPEVTYARHYSPSFDNVMILTKVLMSKSTVGNSCTIVPPDSYDTTKNSPGTVYVKYEDDDFYPQYVIHYGY